jgi:hypothetical protein
MSVTPNTARPDGASLHEGSQPMSRTTRIALAVCALLLLCVPSALASGRHGHDDAVRGSVRDDRITGTRGDDRLYGRRGDDVLRDDRGADHFYGGVGDDRIDARDRAGRHDRRDVVDCGAGDDTVYADDDDVVRHCEHVERAGADNGVDAPGTDDKGGNRAGGTDDPAGHK